MKAAVVSAFDTPPSYGDLPDPAPAGDDEIVVDVLAAGLHPRVRSQANGSHYTSTGDLPLVPGVDGVGCGSDGLVRYFVLSDTTLGSMAERTVIDTRRSVVLPDGTDPVAVAAAMNPAMASWVALRQRVQFQAGQSVLVLGAGNAGQIAVQVAKLLGASRIVVAGRVLGEPAGRDQKHCDGRRAEGDRYSARHRLFPWSWLSEGRGRYGGRSCERSLRCTSISLTSSAGAMAATGT